MSMLDWARKEVELGVAMENDGDEFNYGGECVKSALKAFEALCGDGHNGMSIGFTQTILNRLIDGLPLTPIEDIPENWTLVDMGEGKQMFQCNRCSSLFKHIEAGAVRYSSVGNYVCVDINNGSTYGGGGGGNIVDELYPISMPYWPSKDRIKLYTEDFLVDSRFGDFDTKAYLYLVHPKDGRIEVNRFRKETEEGWVDIDKEEYEARKILSTAAKAIYGLTPKGPLAEIDEIHNYPKCGLVSIEEPNT